MLVPQEKDLRVWWIRNIPNEAHYWHVRTVDDGLNMLSQLAQKDLQDKSIKSNAGGLQVYLNENYDDGDPCFDWIDLATGINDRDELTMELVELMIPVSTEALDKYFGN